MDFVLQSSMLQVQVIKHKAQVHGRVSLIAQKIKIDKRRSV